MSNTPQTKYKAGKMTGNIQKGFLAVNHRHVYDTPEEAIKAYNDSYPDKGDHAEIVYAIVPHYITYQTVTALSLIPVPQKG